MTNPDSSIGTNGAYGGRTSVNAFNDNLAIYTSGGIVSGWACAPSSGMTVALGGTSGVRDVAIAEDPNGNRTTINNISGQPVQVAISAAPATNSRIDSVVAYVENPPAGSSTEVDNPAACGIIAVSGTTAASPSAPSDAAIRSAITADGGTGSTAYYVVLANVTVANGTTDITSDNITPGVMAGIGSNNIDWEALGSKATTNTTSTGTVANGAWATTASLEINQPGTYLLLGTSRAEFYGTSSQNCYMKIDDSTGASHTPISGFYGGKQGETLGQFTITAMGQITITESTNVRARISFSGTQGGFANQNSLAAVRIG